MATRVSGRGDGAVDEEFLHHLYRGGELLANGKVIEAKDFLEKAHKLQPKNEKGQNLLGLTYFKLGLFERAAEIYEALVRENPVDPTLRVNLGLVYLKTSAVARAIREFETAVDLAPEHKKAHNYLGLALAQLGDYVNAREHFQAAGSDAMVAKMERAMAGESTGLHRMPAPLEQQQKGFAEIEGSEVVAEAGGQQVVEDRRASTAGTAANPPDPEMQEVKPGRAPEDWGAHFAEEPPAQAAPPPEVEVEEVVVTEEEAPQEAEAAPEAESEPEPAAAPAAAASEEEELRFAEDEGPSALGSEPAPAASFDTEGPAVTFAEAEVGQVVEAPAAAEPAETEAAAAAAVKAPEPVAETWQAAPLNEVKSASVLPQALAELGEALEVLPGTVAAPFEARPDGAAITISGEMLLRIEGMLVLSGTVKLEPELKRYRGRTTDQAFGQGAARMMRAKGQGVLLVSSPAKSRFVAVDLGDESAYFREDAVYAFEEPVAFENGRIPAEGLGDLDLVHLRGNGKVLLRMDGVLRSHQVKMETPATFPMARLVGWYGNLTPRLLAVGTEESGSPVEAGVELTGEGFALFSAPLS